MPDEVYLVIAPTGGRDDYGALFHEGGHVEHYANTDPGLAFEFRHLGDNSVTESFAFLMEHLVEDRDWLRDKLGVEDPGPATAHARAVMPQAIVLCPQAFSICASNSVVVVLPFVPVIAMTGASTERQPSSSSPIVSIFAKKNCGERRKRINAGAQHHEIVRRGIATRAARRGP